MSNVFVLRGEDGRLLPPATQATVLAKYSRSPLSALELVKGVTPEDAEAFQAKWGVTYGHSSVAELSSMPYCFEGVSIIASKVLESYQRAAYSEKSTRYQEFNADCWVEPAGSPRQLRKAAELLYQAYEDLKQPVFDLMRKRMPDAKARVVKARAFDSLRYLLPAGSGTNLTAVVNARDARYMMSDLLGSTSPELKHLGEQMIAAARVMAPVFAMGARPNTFEPPIKSLGPLPKQVIRRGSRDEWWVCPSGLWTKTANRAESEFWRQVDYRYGIKREFDLFMQGRGKYQVPSLFKTVPIGFEVMMDFGAFRDLQRHRRCEQYVEPLTSNYGFIIPDDIKGTEFEEVFRDAMARAFVICDLLRDRCSPEVIQYALPLGTLHRSIFQMDLREYYYITELRTQPQGHISYRRVAWAMCEIGKEFYPGLTKWCRAIEPKEVGAHT